MGTRGRKSKIRRLLSKDKLTYLFDKETLKGFLEKENIKSVLKPTKKKIIILVCIIFVLTAMGMCSKGKSKPAGTEAITTDIVTRGNVEVAITGSAAVEPNERYEIISMVSGDIITSDYNVGDKVTEGDILYQFDTSATDINMEKQKLSLKQTEISYNNALEKADDLLITAPCNGVISDMKFKVGESVTQGQQIANLQNSRVMRVVLPFNQTQMSSIWVGLSANITSSVNMGSISGKVIDKASVATPQQDGSKLYDVTIEFTNPGAITAGQTVGGEINGMISPASGVVEYSEEGIAKADTEGTITKIYYSNGDYVRRGETIMVLSSDSVSDSIETSSISYQNAQLSLKEQEDKLEDYSITSPISGTVITKNAKAGDTIDKTNSTTVLMVVADISKLKFSLEIDELDVSKVKEGQLVEITCDALPGENYMGIISQVSVEGVAANGVTTYSAEIVIDEPGNLRPSMNIDASIIVADAKNVLMVPTSSIKTAMNRSFVFIPDNGKNKKKGRDNSQYDKKTMLPEAPEGFKAIEVTIGVSGEDFTEIKSGLEEGDVVYSSIVSSGNSSMGMFGSMGGMSGGMGGHPGGMGMGPR